MKDKKSNRPERMLLKENQTIHGESLDAVTPLNIEVTEKNAVQIKKEDEISAVPNANDVSSHLQGFLFTGNTDVRNRLIFQLGQSFSD